MDFSLFYILVEPINKQLELLVFFSNLIEQDEWLDSNIDERVFCKIIIIELISILILLDVELVDLIVYKHLLILLFTLPIVHIQPVIQHLSNRWSYDFPHEVVIKWNHKWFHYFSVHPFQNALQKVYQVFLNPEMHTVRIW